MFVRVEIYNKEVGWLSNFKISYIYIYKLDREVKKEEKMKKLVVV
jgi:hypothetical protein